MCDACRHIDGEGEKARIVEGSGSDDKRLFACHQDHGHPQPTPRPAHFSFLQLDVDVFMSSLIPKCRSKYFSVNRTLIA